ncbi:MAG: hypothetical protein AABN34_20015 [Acidobacteriota bacterium]
MKPFGKTNDGVIDNLLRAYVSRPSNPQQACPEFDPDLANAYIERSLTPGLRLHYEEHLSECVACRKNVAALVRLADPTVAVASVSPGDKSRAASASAVGRVFGALSRPQWAMATAAVIVLAISIPVLMSRNESRLDKQVSERSDAAAPPAENAQSRDQRSEAAPAASAKPSTDDSSTSGGANSKQREKREAETAALNPPARNAGMPGGTGAAAEPPKTDAKGAPQSVGETRTAEGQAATKQPSQAGAAPESQLAKNDSDKPRQQQGKDSAQQSNEAKQDRADEPRDKEKAARAEEAAAPPPSTSTSEVARARGGLKRAPAKLSLRDSTGEAVRPSERKISSKKFLFRDNTWTDKDFDPNKDLPVVTIIRDSNVYREVLAKRAGLRPYLTAFETERAIIVYKGTVYKLIPQ